MELGAVSLAILAAMVLLLLAGVPFAFVTGVIGVVLCLWKFGPDSLSLLGSRAYSFLDSFTLVSVPLFILMASLLERSGVARELYQAVYVWAGRVAGGVGVVSIGVAVVIGAAIGVSGGEMVLLGLVALPQLLRLGYDEKLSCGLICAGGALGTLIPPSLVLVFYGLTANVSVADLFVASALPGLMLAAIYAAYVLVRCQLNPALGPPPPAEEVSRPLREKLAMLKAVALPVAVAFSVLGSIYLGLASVTESAALGVAGTLIAIALRRELNFALVRDALRQTASACGTVLWLVLGTNALIGVYNVMGGIDYATSLLKGLPLDPFGVLLLMLGIWIALGFFIDWIGILLLTAPIFVPTATALGYDPIWFGTLFNFCMMIGYLTPPFAPAAFFLKGIAPPQITLEKIYASLWPFIGLQLIGLALVIAFPSIATWLPSVLGTDMRRKLVVPPGMQNLVERFGYAPGVLVGDTLYVSGQVGRDENLAVILDPEGQIEQAFRNVGKVLEAAGFAWADVVELETWLLHFQRDLPLVLKIKPRFLGETVTTWTGFGVAEFSMPGIVFEVKVTAVRGS